jgi:hypothetical protein
LLLDGFARFGGRPVEMVGGFFQMNRRVGHVRLKVMSLRQSGRIRRVESLTGGDEAGGDEVFL